jgi:hypothetical protein
VSFSVTCNAPGPSTGSIKITVATSGSNPDADGYSVSLDNGTAQHIEPAGSYTFDGVAAASHRVELAGLAANCRTSDNPRSVDVTAGTLTTTTFEVTCESAAIKWTTVPLGSSYYWSDLWASGPTNILVPGVAFDPSRSTIQHYDGQQWSEQLRRGDTTIVEVWGSSATNVFAVGQEPVFSPLPRTGAIFHFDGSRWSDVAGPNYGGTVQVSYNAVWGSGQDVFVGGYILRGPAPVPEDSVGQLLIHYDGSQWSEIPAMPFGPGSIVRHLSGSSPTNVWATGDYTLCDDCNHRMNFVARYDGTSWTLVYSTSDNTFNGIWVGAANDVWVVGHGFDNDGYMLHFDGTTWKETFRRTPDGFQAPPINDVWGSSGSDIYAAGDEGVLHFDGSAWTLIDNKAALRVWGTSADDIYVLDNSSVRHGTR